MRVFKSIGASLLVAGVCLLPETATAKTDPTQIVVATGLTVTKSTWRGDAGAQGSGKLGLQALNWLTAYFQGRLGAGIIDERLMTYVSLGIELHPFQWGRWRPHLGLAFSHQHEETIYVVKESPAGALFGIGDGIRHRAGGEGILGISYELGREGSVTGFASLETNLVWFPDPRGPEIYFGVSSMLGVRYAL